VDARFFDPAHGGQPLLWQHLFWIFGHPDVYLIFLPATGIVSSIVPVFSRRRLEGYVLVVLATIATAVISFGVWVHHMFATGLPSVSLGFFAAASMVIAVPSGVQVFAWLTTMVRGRIRWDTPMLFVVGFLVTFVIGGLSGVMFPVIAVDWQVHDTYFVVAHFHYVLFGGAVFPVLAGLYYWIPKMTGRMLGEGVGRASFWLVFVGFNVTFFPMHISGLLGMTRRIATYRPDDGLTEWNLLSTIGSYVLAIGLLLTLVNIVVSVRRGRAAGNDPWLADSLEWSVASPPPAYNFVHIPRVDGRHPLWDRPERAEDGPVLAGGHEAMGTTVLDADAEQVLHMPGPTWVPLLLSLALTALFIGLIVQALPVAAVALALALVVLAVWHAHPFRGAG
jgi:cytochrome c oxidase subunit 1/cytochrome c oxidase subunit I+III